MSAGRQKGQAGNADGSTGNSAITTAGRLLLPRGAGFGMITAPMPAHLRLFCLFSAIATLSAAPPAAQPQAPAGPRIVAVGDVHGAGPNLAQILQAAGLIDAKQKWIGGTARLVPPQTPFGIAVSPAGEQLHDVVFTLRDLPAPASLGSYTTYVAWATTPQLHPEIRLGEVRNGQVRLGRVSFDRFLILVTAESSPSPRERAGRPGVGSFPGHARYRALPHRAA